MLGSLGLDQLATVYLILRGYSISEARARASKRVTPISQARKKMLQDSYLSLDQQLAIAQMVPTPILIVQKFPRRFSRSKLRLNFFVLILWLK